MTNPQPEQKLCSLCNTRKSGPYPDGLCRKCYDLRRVADAESRLPADLKDKVRRAEATGDWKTLAETLGETFKGVAAGTIKATAAQASVLKHIMDRAYGRVSKTQEDKLGPTGVVILPTLGNAETTHICDKCIEAHRLHG